MGEDFGKFDPKFAAAIFDENLEKFASMALETRTYFYDSIRHSIVDPPHSRPFTARAFPGATPRSRYSVGRRLIGFACAWYERCFAVCGP